MVRLIESEGWDTETVDEAIKVHVKMREMQRADWESEQEMTAWFCYMMMGVESQNLDYIDGKAFLLLIKYNEDAQIIKNMVKTYNEIQEKMKESITEWVKPILPKPAPPPSPTTELGQHDSSD